MSMVQRSTNRTHVPMSVVGGQRRFGCEGCLERCNLSLRAVMSDVHDHERNEGSESDGSDRDDSEYFSKLWRDIDQHPLPKATTPAEVHPTKAALASDRGLSESDAAKVLLAIPNSPPAVKPASSKPLEAHISAEKSVQIAKETEAAEIERGERKPFYVPHYAHNALAANEGVSTATSPVSPVKDVWEVTTAMHSVPQALQDWREEEWKTDQRLVTARYSGLEASLRWVQEAKGKIIISPQAGEAPAPGWQPLTSVFEPTHQWTPPAKLNQQKLPFNRGFGPTGFIPKPRPSPQLTGTPSLSALVQGQPQQLVALMKDPGIIQEVVARDAAGPIEYSVPYSPTKVPPAGSPDTTTRRPQRMSGFMRPEHFGDEQLRKDHLEGTSEFYFDVLSPQRVLEKTPVKPTPPPTHWSEIKSPPLAPVTPSSSSSSSSAAAAAAARTGEEEDTPLSGQKISATIHQKLWEIRRKPRTLPSVEASPSKQFRGRNHDDNNSNSNNNGSGSGGGGSGGSGRKGGGYFKSWAAESPLPAQVESDRENRLQSAAVALAAEVDRWSAQRRAKRDMDSSQSQFANATIMEMLEKDKEKEDGSGNQAAGSRRSTPQKAAAASPLKRTGSMHFSETKSTWVPVQTPLSPALPRY
jgi:hypothetical protein